MLGRWVEKLIPAILSGIELSQSRILAFIRVISPLVSSVSRRAVICMLQAPPFNRTLPSKHHEIVGDFSLSLYPSSWRSTYYSITQIACGEHVPGVWDPSGFQPFASSCGHQKFCRFLFPWLNPSPQPIETLQIPMEENISWTKFTKESFSISRILVHLFISSSKALLCLGKYKLYKYSGFSFLSCFNRNYSLSLPVNIIITSGSKILYLGF